METLVFMLKSYACFMEHAWILEFFIKATHMLHVNCMTLDYEMDMHLVYLHVPCMDEICMDEICMDYCKCGNFCGENFCTLQKFLCIALKFEEIFLWLRLLLLLKAPCDNQIVIAVLLQISHHIS